MLGGHERRPALRGDSPGARRRHDPDAFIDAEHEVWRPAHSVLASAQALLDSLRARGSRPASSRTRGPSPAACSGRRGGVRARRAARRDGVLRARWACASRTPEIFLHALPAARVEAGATMYVGDNLVDRCAGRRRRGHDHGSGAVVQSRRHPGDRAGLHGVHADGRAERGAATSSIERRKSSLAAVRDVRTMFV